MAEPVFIPKKSKGNSNPRCYLRDRKGCCDQISQEHYVSKSLLERIERTNLTIDVAGLAWIPEGKLKSIGKNSLTAGVLCRDHNSALNGLDTEVGNLVDAVFEIDQELVQESPQPKVFEIDGTHIERWVIKTMIGMVEARVLSHPQDEKYSYKPTCIDLLCSKAARWPAYWGLYLQIPEGKVYHSSSFEFAVRYSDDGVIHGAEIKFNGLGMNFLLGRVDNPSLMGIHRPREIAFRKQGVQCVIRFNWGALKAGQSAWFDWSGNYSGPAPSHDLPRA